jgi:hypothetical protein
VFVGSRRPKVAPYGVCEPAAIAAGGTDRHQRTGLTDNVRWVAVLINLGFRAIWHPRRGAFLPDAAGRAGHRHRRNRSRAALLQAVWFSQIHPVSAQKMHSINHTSRSQSPAIGPGEGKYTLEMKVKFWSNPREPSIRSNTVSLSDGKGGSGTGRIRPLADSKQVANEEPRPKRFPDEVLNLEVSQHPRET